MYVVRRAFRNCGQMMVPGSVVEPGTVKRFKSRLSDGHILEVREQDFDRWNEYFKVRYGVELAASGGVPTEPANLDGTESEAPAEEPKTEAPAEEPKTEPEKVVKVVKPATATVVVKAH